MKNNNNEAVINYTKFHTEALYNFGMALGVDPKFVDQIPLNQILFLRAYFDYINTIEGIQSNFNYMKIALEEHKSQNTSSESVQ